MIHIDYFFSFIFFSFLGWILEVFYRSISNKRFINPGLFKGPYLILYGTGALVLIICIPLVSTANLFVKILVYFVATTGLELFAGLIGECLSPVRLWDYSNRRFQFRGHICLEFSLYWIILAFVFEYLFLSLYQTFLAWLPFSGKVVFSWCVFFIMLSDFIFISTKRVFYLKGKVKKDYLSLKSEFDALAAPLLENPSVKELAKYKHHREKTRLAHVIEVAWLSFIWGKYLSSDYVNQTSFNGAGKIHGQKLDCRAIVRGAILHDLFFYDWLREGPKLHGFRHCKISLKNAQKIVQLMPKEIDIIKKHMWPLTIIPPRYKESLLVCLVDSYCMLKDYLQIKAKGGVNK
jgi:uncharacterized protein